MVKPTDQDYKQTTADTFINRPQAIGIPNQPQV